MSKLTRPSRPAAMAFLLCLAVGTAGVTNAQELLTANAASQPSSDDVFSIASHQSWQVVCDGDATQSRCHLSAAGKPVGEQPKPIAMFLSSVRQDDGSLVLVLETPLDLLVSKGIELRVDGGQPLLLSYRSCHMSGCVAPFRLDDRIRRSFTKGTRLIARVYDLQARPIDVEFSLMGFTDASNAMGS